VFPAIGARAALIAVLLVKTGRMLARPSDQCQRASVQKRRFSSGNRPPAPCTLDV